MRKKAVLYHYLIWLLIILLISGCGVNVRKERKVVSDSIGERIGKGLSPVYDINVTQIPKGVDLSDGLTEDESISVALWNNASFQADLVQLGYAIILLRYF